MSAKIGNTQIVNFFLDLYKLQSGVPKTSEAEAKPVSIESKLHDHVFELRLKKDDRWFSRRMSVSAIGENSGGKSQCYKVAYDDLLVIKIPPKPITDFQEYLESIRLEKEITAQLGASVQWVSPGISAILRKIHRFPDESKLNSLELEHRYLMWLNDNYQYLKYLKIAEAYVFFMDLSRYQFLSSVVHELYREDDRTEQIILEMDRSADMISANSGAGMNIGLQEEAIYSRMQHVFADYESQVRILIRKLLTLRQLKSLTEISRHDINNWFIAYMSGEPLIKPDQNYPEEFVRGLLEIIQTIIAEHEQEVQEYKQIILKVIAERQDRQRIPRIRGLITNLLSLLVALTEKHISIRDLKPDNIFVAGDYEQYPLFLSQAENYSLGLIDFETAVSVDQKRNAAISQPLIGGTPSYATPSHFFDNNILKDELGDLRRIFFYQDWYASLGIIYNIATSAPLFAATRKSLHKMFKMRQAFAANKIPLTEVFVHGSKQFWRIASEELQLKLNQQERRLKSIVITLPDNVKEMFHRALVIECRNLHESIGMEVISQQFFDSYDKRKNLIQLRQQEIAKIRLRLSQEKITQAASAKKRQQALQFLENLEYLKFLAEQRHQIGNFMAKPQVNISIYQLLGYIFEMVSTAMYKLEWGRLERTTVKPLTENPPSMEAPQPANEPRHSEQQHVNHDDEATVICDIECD